MTSFARLPIAWIVSACALSITLPAAPGSGQGGAASPQKTAPTSASAAASRPQGEKPALEQPPDFKAYNEALRATVDGPKKLELLRKLLTDYPDTPLRSSVDTQIKGLLLRQATAAAKEYLAAADASLQSQPYGPMLAHQLVASELLRSEVFLDRAEAYALAGLQAETAEQYLARERARERTASTPGKGLPPNTTIRYSTSAAGVSATLIPTSPTVSPRRERTDEEILSSYRSTRGSITALLGQIYIKRGKTEQAHTELKEAYDALGVSSPMKAVVARELAKLALTARDDRAAVEYLMTCVMSGAGADVWKDLHEAYGRAHGGTLAGLEAMLDERYAAWLPKVAVTPFVRPRTARPRLVLAELFTGAECVPCVGVDLAFDAALERYAREDLALLVYHQHIPGPDPMATSATDSRRRFYGVYGVPTYYIDGRTDGSGGATADSAPGLLNARIGPSVEKAMGVAPEARLTLSTRLAGSRVEVRAAVDRVTSRSNQLRLQIVLAEERVRYQGGNGVRFHSMVVRGVAGAHAAGFEMSAGRSLRTTWTFDLEALAADHRRYIDEYLAKPRGGDRLSVRERREAIDPARLVVVAFVQDEDPAQGEVKLRQAVTARRILQAASAKVRPAR